MSRFPRFSFLTALGVLALFPVAADIPVSLVSYSCSESGSFASVDCKWKGGGCTVRVFVQASGYCVDGRCTEFGSLGCTTRTCHRFDAHADDACTDVYDADSITSICPKPPGDDGPPIDGCPDGECF